MLCGTILRQCPLIEIGLDVGQRQTVTDVFIDATIVITAMLVLSAIVTVYQFHYDTDAVVDASIRSTTRNYYEEAYSPDGGTPERARFETDEEYVLKAREHAVRAGVPQMIDRFVESAGLEGSRVLEIGGGSGLLQDVAAGYVALDLSVAAGRFFRKPFVAASATEIPFADDTFDAVWSIWVLEHVNRPEQALNEMRRVVRNGGYILLRPAWECDPWAAEGYEVRPYRDLDLKGKLIKASIPIRTSRWYSLLYSRQVRALRALHVRFSGQPSRLRYTRLAPNYSKYWVTDSDALVSLDFFEFVLWFTSRGDTCLDCPPIGRFIYGGFGQPSTTLVVRVNKPERDRRMPEHVRGLRRSAVA